MRTSRPPRWLLIWTATFAFVCLSAVTLEFLWRYAGYTSTVADSPALWQWWREYAEAGGHRSIAIIGASRGQAGLSTAELRRRLPRYRVCQLSDYGGGSPIGVLRLLARSERFRGVVICDLVEPFLLKEYWDSQEALYRDHIGSAPRCEALLFAMAQQRCAFVSSSTGLLALCKELIEKGTVRPPDYFRMLADRSVELDFQHVRRTDEQRAASVDKYRRKYLRERKVLSTDLKMECGQIDVFVRSIELRGGRVVFVRMPSSGYRRALEDEFHPREAFWDRLAKDNHGLWIHADDINTHGPLVCPDESHLQYRDAIAFTGDLVDELIRSAVVMAE